MRLLYPNSLPYKHLEMAPEGYAYFFKVIKFTSESIHFVLTEWSVADTTRAALEADRLVVEVYAICLDPRDEFAIQDWLSAFPIPSGIGYRLGLWWE